MPASPSSTIAPERPSRAPRTRSDSTHRSSVRPTMPATAIASVSGCGSVEVHDPTEGATRVGAQHVRCDDLTGNGVPAPGWVAQR